MTDTNKEALARAVSVLREVTQKLIQGTSKTAFEQEFRGKYVSPGVTVQQYIRQLRLAGDLCETDTTIKLKSPESAVAA